MAGRPRGCATIVEEGEIIPPAAIREENWRLSTLGEEVNNTLSENYPVSIWSCHCAIEN
jgi:hypothetical protein